MCWCITELPSRLVGAYMREFLPVLRSFEPTDVLKSCAILIDGATDNDDTLEALRKPLALITISSVGRSADLAQ